jgi:hypothetical protein
MRRRTTQPMLNWTGIWREQERDIADVVVLPATDPTSGGSPGASRPRTADDAPTAHTDRLSRELVIDEILSLNPSATVEFLDSFSEPRLRLYLTRLRTTEHGRGRGARWLRVGDSPAIVSHERML